MPRWLLITVYALAAIVLLLVALGLLGLDVEAR